MAALLGIDIGTSAVKVLVVSETGEILAQASRTYPLSQPFDGWSEQNPDEWWAATTAAVREASASFRDTIVGIGLSGQMHGLVALDRDRLGTPADGACVRPCILWNDQRAVAECTELEHLAGGARSLVEKTGNGAFPGFTLPKLLWVRRHEPALFDRVGKVLLPKDYCLWRMTGQFATDVGDASGTSLFSPADRQWHAGLMKSAHVEPDLLPTVLESAAVAGRLSRSTALAWGLPSGLPVAAGSGDNMAGAIGAGVVSPGTCLVAIGTSGVVLSPTASCRPDLDLPNSVGRTHTMCHADGTATKAGSWCITGCTLSAGFALQWAHDTLWPETSYETLYAEAEATPPGADGLVFLPQLTGERCPHRDPHARGGWIGLSSRHTRGHLVRSLLQGVTFTLEQILRIQESQGAVATEVRIGGGGARSPFWRQMVADVFNSPVVTVASEDTPALGAALLGGVAAGVWPSVADAAANAVRVTGRTLPVRPSRYAEARLRFAATYAHVRPLWSPSL